MRTRATGISVVLLTTMLVVGCGGISASSRSGSRAAGNQTQWPSQALNAISSADCISAVGALSSLSTAWRSASGQSQLAAVAKKASDVSSALGFMINTSPGLDESIALDIQAAASDADGLGVWVNDYLGGLPGSAPHMQQEARAVLRDTTLVYSTCGRHAPGSGQPSGPAAAPKPQTTPPPARSSMSASGPIALGRLAGVFAHGSGFGLVKPSTINNGGDPSGIVTHISWTSWGGTEAVGTGIGEYVGPGQSIATGSQEPTTVIAFDLGTCDGKLMYRAVEWYFPQHGQAFDPGNYENICSGTYAFSS